MKKENKQDWEKFKKDAQTEDTYIVKVTCTNCGNNDVVRVPKGTLINSYLKFVGCAECGCSTYSKTPIVKKERKNDSHLVTSTLIIS